jgi:protein-S-isoprenylcysteine O-methyltransferase Ste14
MNIGIAGGSLWLPISLSLVAFGSFSWALRGHFKVSGRMPTGMRLLSLFSLLSYISYVGLVFWRGYEVQISTIVGLAGITASIILFWWAVITTRQHRPSLAYTDADPDIIYVNGPYGHIRHPFYLSYIIFWVGAALVAGMWQWAPALILALWYIRIAQEEEKRFRSSTLSTGYESYRVRTGMLLPRLGSSRR